MLAIKPKVRWFIPSQGYQTFKADKNLQQGVLWRSKAIGPVFLDFMAC
jgi:hypothetical protein